MRSARTGSLVHLELHTPAPEGAHAFYGDLCGWRQEQVHTSAGSYLALGLSSTIGGGIVECPIGHPLWLPYIEVADIHQSTDRAERLGARVLLTPREGPVGWRSVISMPAAGEIALWQAKR